MEFTSEFACSPTDSASSFFQSVSTWNPYIYSFFLSTTETLSKPPVTTHKHTSQCLANNVVPLPLPRAALLLALPLPLPVPPPLLSSRRLTRLPPLPSSTLLPCRPLPSRAPVPVSSARWLPPLRKCTFLNSYCFFPASTSVKSRAIYIFVCLRKTPLTYMFLGCSGVAVGSSIGHAIGGFFGGGGSSAPAEAQQAPPAQSQGMDSGLWQSSATNQTWENPACEANVRDFRNCMDENNGNISICGWYMDQLVRFYSGSSRSYLSGTRYNVNKMLTIL